MNSLPPDNWPPEFEQAGLRPGELIGEGGFSWVYRAHHPEHGEVAVKLWKAPLGERDRVKFHREWNLHRALAGNPRIVRMYEAVTPPRGRPWTVTELYECSLQDRLRNGPAIRRDEAFTIADDLLAGLEAIHRTNHLHRDVKPANVLLREGRAALGDLGILLPVGDSTLAPGAGTASYLAPELAPELADGSPSFRSDVYSAAVTLRQLFGPKQAGPVDELLARAAHERPEQRPADASELRALLLTARRGEGVRVLRPLSPVPGGPEPAPTVRSRPAAGHWQPAAPGLSPRRRLLLGALCLAAGVLALLAVAHWA